MHMKFLLGTKEKMTQVFDEEGRVWPVTVVSAGPVFVVRKKTKEKDGYDAVQVGFGERKLKNINKPQRNIIHPEKKNMGFRYLKEFRVADPKQLEEIKEGDKITVDVFEEGEEIVVSGTSKGKGFQGVVKRWGFAGGPRSHGQKHSEREPGSIGATGPQRVFKGTKMAGRMGGRRTTIKGLKVVKIDKDNNLLYISGALPGGRNTLLEIRAE